MARKPSPGPHQTELLSVRLEPDVARRLKEAARFEGITASAAARRAILRELRRADVDDRAAS
jgi:hypothetical protein